MTQSMPTRQIGQTGVHLSVVGMGTSQLQMLPQRQAVNTLVRAFEGGVNWVHTAPDYGGVEPWIKQAIRASGRQVMVATGSPPRSADLPAFFENTCHVFETPRLALYGIAGIEDIEWFGENVWGAGGMVDYLQRKKAEGRLGALYCTTHGNADYVERLIHSGVFDAIMLAWNPLGFHQQSHAWARHKIGRHHEDLIEFKDRIFPLAQARGVSLLVMRPLAGGMLIKSRAFEPHDWQSAPGEEQVSAPDVLRQILDMPGVCSVLPGMASVEEAAENISAAEPAVAKPAETQAHIDALVAQRRSNTCNRCGDCETTCSQQLAIPAMFRDAALWTLRSELNQADRAENYFDLHPDPTLACVSCSNRSCECSHGIDIPQALGIAHAQMQKLRQSRQHPGPTAALADHTFDGPYKVLVLTRDVPTSLAAGAMGTVHLLLRNEGTQQWLATQHNPDPTVAMGVAVLVNGQVASIVPLLNTINPDEHFLPVVFEFAAPTAPGNYALQLGLRTLAATGAAAVPMTIFYTGALVAEATAPATRPSKTSMTPATPETSTASAPSTPYQRIKQWLTPAPAPQPSAPYAAQLLEHTFPAQANNGVTHGVLLRLQNTGTLPWQAHAAGSQGVHVHVLVDNVLLAPLGLADAEVPPGAETAIHFPFRAPDQAGPHTIRLELHREDGAALPGHRPIAWTHSLQVNAAPWTRTVELFELERNHNPWHYNPFQGITHTRDGKPLPLFIERAQGSRVWDVEGNEFIDYTMGWGSTILGHADPRIQAAIRDTLDCGAVTPFPHPLEMEVSRMLVEDFAPHEMVAFGKNGSDVCTIAARLARVTTGKRVILSCGYHGWQDFGLEYFAFQDCGIPYPEERSLHKFRFNDTAGFLALYARHKHELAAVMIEPACPLIDDVAGLGGEPDLDFLHVVADATRRAKALLVFDEIVTGFRYRNGSVQKDTGIVPDLTCLGKALASGMPLSALLGSQKLFLPSFHKTHFHPTFRGEVYSLAAAKAAIQIYRTEPVAQHIWQHGEALRQGIHGVCAELGVAGVCTGTPFRLSFIFTEPDLQRRRLKRTLLMQELVKQRVLTVAGTLLTTTAHDAETLAITVNAFRTALTVVAHADKTDTLHSHLDMVVN